MLIYPCPTNQSVASNFALHMQFCPGSARPRIGRHAIPSRARRRADGAPGARPPRRRRHALGRAAGAAAHGAGAGRRGLSPYACAYTRTQLHTLRTVRTHLLAFTQGIEVRPCAPRTLKRTNTLRMHLRIPRRRARMRTCMRVPRTRIRARGARARRGAQSRRGPACDCMCVRGACVSRARARVRACVRE